MELFKQFNRKEGCDKCLLLRQYYNGATIYLGDSFTKKTIMILTV